MEALKAVKPGVKAVTVRKSVVTKSMRDAHDAAAKLDAVIIPLGNGGGHTLVSKAEAERRKLIDKARAELEAANPDLKAEREKADAKAVVIVQTENKKRAAAKAPSIVQIAAENPEAVVVEPVAETTEQVIAREVAEGRLTPVGPAPREKKPYNPEKLSGAAEAGKAPKKGQLPAGLLAYLAKKHEKSTIIAAAAGIAAPAKKAKKAKK